MALLERLSRLVTGARPTDALARALHECHSGARRSAQHLALHADLAPLDQFAVRLRELAAADDSQAAKLAEALRALGQTPAATVSPDPAPERVAPNYWGRLVYDLETHRRAVRRLREWATRFAEGTPAATQLFEELCHREAEHCEALRELIARADPQALD